MNGRIRTAAFAAVWLTIFIELFLDRDLARLLLSQLAAHPYLAPFALTLVQVLLASVVLPCSALTALAGLLWGFQLGFLYSIAATLAASATTFMLARHVLNIKMHNMWGSNRWFRIAMRLVERYGWKAAMIAHANPILPGSSLGYAFGLSSVSFWPYLLGALAGTLPLQIAMVGLGHVIGLPIRDGDIVLWLLVAAVGLATMIAAYLIKVPVILRTFLK